MDDSWKERVREEVAALHANAQKLEHFLNHVEVPSLSQTQHGLLHAQLHVMNAYVSILTLRLLSD